MQDNADYLKSQLYFNFRTRDNDNLTKTLLTSTILLQSTRKCSRFAMKFYFMTDIQENGNKLIIYFGDEYLILQRTSLPFGILRLFLNCVVKDLYSKFSKEDTTNEIY